MADNSSSLSLLTVLKPGGSSHIGAESKPAKTIDQMIGHIGHFVLIWHIGTKVIDLDS